VTGKQNVT